MTCCWVNARLLPSYDTRNIVLQVMHIAAVTEVHSRLLPSLEALHVSVKLFTCKH